MKKGKRHERKDLLPVTLLEKELQSLRRDLRTSVRAFAARLEITLAESAAAIRGYRRQETLLSRDQLYQIRELTTLLRKRKLSPEKGRRKDLRKLDNLIREMHEITHPGASRDGG